MTTITDLPEEAVAVQPTARAKSPRTALGKAMGVTATALLVISVVALLALAILRSVGGYQPAVMLTGSMAPMIIPGDVVVTQTIPLQDLKVGDVITYRIPVEDHRTVTHRVSEITTDDNGALAVRTKGDANPNPDYWTSVLTGPETSKHIFTIPHLGTAIRIISEPAILYTLTYGAAALFLVRYLTSLWRKPKARPAGMH